MLYAYDEKQLEEAKKKIGRNYTVQRYKGLGEMNPAQLWETTMNPQGRTMIRVTIEDAAEAERLVSTLRGDKVEPRRDFIAEFANFNKKDHFEVAGQYDQED